MGDPEAARRVVRFGVFELDVRSGELRKSGSRLNLPDQPFNLLIALLERPGEIVTRDHLRERLWPGDTFVDFEHGLNAAVKRLRDTLGDSAETPRFIETIPRRGYRFVSAIEPVPVPDTSNAARTAALPPAPDQPKRSATPFIDKIRRRTLLAAGALLALALAAVIGGRSIAKVVGNRSAATRSHAINRRLTRITTDPGLQTDVSWSPAGDFIAYASDKAGNFDIWVQPVAGGAAVQVTKSPEQDTDPDWSPSGSAIVFRSERDGGGLYVVSAFGGPEHRVASFGVHPRWSPDGSRILFTANGAPLSRSLYVVGLDGAAPVRALKDWTDEVQFRGLYAWHPDGRRISVVATTKEKGYGLYTVPLAGGLPVFSKFPLNSPDEPGVALFVWAPSGTALYFEGYVDLVANLWRLKVDPATLELHDLERLTTGGGSDIHPALSRDGTHLAFTTAAASNRLWSFGFDAATGRMSETGEALTSPTAEQFTSELAPDGHRFAWTQTAVGTGQYELWVGDLTTGEKHLLARDQQSRNSARWSPDGQKLAYQWVRTSGELTVAVRAVDGGDEQLLSSPVAAPADKPTATIQPLAWSPRGDSVLVASDVGTPERHALWLWPIAAAPHADARATRLAFDPGHDLWQGTFSPNGRWLSFEAVKHSDSDGTAVVYVIPSTGAPFNQWTPLTESHEWADKPRWSPDGKMLYFWRLRGWLLHVWALRFDAAHGHAIGQPFQVTHFDTPARHISTNLGGSEPSVSRTAMILPMTEMSGSIWMLDDVDR